MKIGIENYFASLSSFEQHFCTLWNFSFSRLYFSLKPLHNRLRRCCFKTIFSTAVIIYFPLRDNYLISTTANCLRITRDHFRLEVERKKKGSWFLLDLITAAVHEGRYPEESMRAASLGPADQLNEIQHTCGRLQVVHSHLDSNVPQPTALVKSYIARRSSACKRT